MVGRSRSAGSGWMEADARRGRGRGGGGAKAERRVAARVSSFDLSWTKPRAQPRGHNARSLTCEPCPNRLGPDPGRPPNSPRRPWSLRAASNRFGARRGRTVTNTQLLITRAQQYGLLQALRGTTLSQPTTGTTNAPDPQRPRHRGRSRPPGPVPAPRRPSGRQKRARPR